MLAVSGILIKLEYTKVVAMHEMRNACNYGRKISPGEIHLNA